MRCITQKDGTILVVVWLRLRKDMIGLTKFDPVAGVTPYLGAYEWTPWIP